MAGSQTSHADVPDHILSSAAQSITGSAPIELRRYAHSHPLVKIPQTIQTMVIPSPKQSFRQPLHPKRSDMPKRTSLPGSLRVAYYTTLGIGPCIALAVSRHTAPAPHSLDAPDFGPKTGGALPSMRNPHLSMPNCGMEACERTKTRTRPCPCEMWLQNWHGRGSAKMACSRHPRLIPVPIEREKAAQSPHK